MQSHLFTSESVSDGHPDKICDQISDALLDRLLTEDREARAGLECLCAKDFLVIAGEFRSRSDLSPDDLDATARAVIGDIGYDFDGFDHKNCKIDIRVQPQSVDIAQGVDRGTRESEGAGDQGMMFGFACDETEHLMPAPIDYAHEILRHLRTRRRAGALPGLRPDAKAQVTMEYQDGTPVRCDTVLVSSHHEETLDLEEVRRRIAPEIRAALPDGLINDRTRILINPTGRFVIGGPESDTGLTGRKIIVDTYGGAALHGGGAFSGKDPTKVDRSAAYAARYLAKNVVAAGLASRCAIQLSYAIGVAHPLSIYADTYGTGAVDEAAIEAALDKVMDLTPRGIRLHLGLNRPIYSRTAGSRWRLQLGTHGSDRRPEGCSRSGFGREKVLDRVPHARPQHALRAARPNGMTAPRSAAAADGRERPRLDPGAGPRHPASR